MQSFSLMSDHNKAPPTCSWCHANLIKTMVDLCPWFFETEVYKSSQNINYVLKMSVFSFRARWCWVDNHTRRASHIHYYWQHLLKCRTDNGGKAKTAIEVKIRLHNLLFRTKCQIPKKLKLLLKKASMYVFCVTNGR